MQITNSNSLKQRSRVSTSDACLNPVPYLSSVLREAQTFPSLPMKSSLGWFLSSLDKTLAGLKLSCHLRQDFQALSCLFPVPYLKSAPFPKSPYPFQQEVVLRDQSLRVSSGHCCWVGRCIQAYSVDKVRQPFLMKYFIYIKMYI